MFNKEKKSIGKYQIFRKNCPPGQDVSVICMGCIVKYPDPHFINDIGEAKG